MQFSREDAGAERIATIDIETTHYKPREGETVSIGIGEHTRSTPGSEATYHTFHREGDDEADLIERAVSHLDELPVDLLVSYKGRGFDFDFLAERCAILGTGPVSSTLNTRDTHVDLYEDRKREADRRNKKWPSLEECLASYGFDCPTTLWNSQEVTNTRFGEELGPAYLDAVSRGSDDVENLEAAIDHYLQTDLEANFAIYYADIGEEFTPEQLGTTASF